MLFQHDPAEPVGIWLDLREDHRGLYARGRLIPDAARGRELLSLLRAGAIDGLSIGFRTVTGRIDPKTRIRRLHAVNLWEISIVTFPLLAGARVRAVKQAFPPPALSHARTRAERAWADVTGTADSAATPLAPTGHRGGGPRERVRAAALSAGERPRSSPVMPPTMLYGCVALWTQRYPRSQPEGRCALQSPRSPECSLTFQSQTFV